MRKVLLPKAKNRDAEEKQACRPEQNQSAVPFLTGIHDGSEIQVVDISREGMLLETEARLRPQMKIQLKLATREGLIKINGCVQRSSIASLKGVPRYQTTIAFENPFRGSDALSQDSETPSVDKQETDEPQHLYLVIVKKVRPAQ